ncbi:MAG: glycoside hydrolase family 28 protein [Bacteroidetes bacterium]|nr:glycoside hydrolase family 28 protein [Bacteroidota bacterium]
MQKKKITFITGTLTLSIMFLLTAFCVYKDSPETGHENGWSSVPKILARIKAPAFPDKEFNVKDFGAAADDETDSRHAIQKAVDVCNAEGGGRVIIPPGNYKVNGPIHLKSNVNLHLQKGAYLKFSVNPDDYLPTVLVRWEGTRCYNYSPLVYAYRQENIAITGEGTLDGQVKEFWQLWKLIHDRDKIILRNMGKQLVHVEQRQFGKGHFLRPTFIEPYECKNVFIEGITVKNSPFWTIHPVLCENVIVRKVTVEKGMSNDDGCDPESSKDVLIEDCSFFTNDDNIAIKAGRDNDAWLENGGKPSENIIIRNNKFIESEAGAITIGSEMSGSVRNVFAENNHVHKAGQAFYIKSNTDRGGAVENVYVRNISIDSCTNQAALIQLDYKGAAAGKHPSEFNNFYFEDVKCNFAKIGTRIFGLPSKTISDITFKNFEIENAEKSTEVYYTQNLVFNNFVVKKITAVQKEYLGSNQSSEEKEGRLHWKDLPAAVQKTLLSIINSVIDTKKSVSEKARQDVKDAFAADPMVTEIEKLIIKGKVIYRIEKDFGDNDIKVQIAEDGELLMKN